MTSGLGRFGGHFGAPDVIFGGSGGCQEGVRRVPGPPPRTHLPLSLGAPPQSGPKTHLDSHLGPTMDLLYSFLLSLPGPPEPPTQGGTQLTPKVTWMMRNPFLTWTYPGLWTTLAIIYYRLGPTVALDLFV